MKIVKIEKLQIDILDFIKTSQNEWTVEQDDQQERLDALRLQIDQAKCGDRAREALLKILGNTEKRVVFSKVIDLTDKFADVDKLTLQYAINSLGIAISNAQPHDQEKYSIKDFGNDSNRQLTIKFETKANDENDKPSDVDFSSICDESKRYVKIFTERLKSMDFQRIKRSKGKISENGIVGLEAVLPKVFPEPSSSDINVINFKAVPYLHFAEYVKDVLRLKKITGASIVSDKDTSPDKTLLALTKCFHLSQEETLATQSLRLGSTGAVAALNDILGTALTLDIPRQRGS